MACGNSSGTNGWLTAREAQGPAHERSQPSVTAAEKGRRRSGRLFEGLGGPWPEGKRSKLLRSWPRNSGAHSMRVRKLTRRRRTLRLGTTD